MEAPKFEKEAWKAPTISDLGSLEELTAICNTGGAGDSAYPGNTGYSTEYISPSEYCKSS